MSLRLRSWPLSGISLVHVCQFHCLARDLFLHSLDQLAHTCSRSCSLAGVTCKASRRCPKVSTAACTFARTLLALRPVVAALRAALRRGLQGAGVVQYG